MPWPRTRVECPTPAAIVRLLTDVLCPERCAACTAIVPDSQLFCHACRARVNVLAPPECERCGKPAASAAECKHGTADAVRRARAWAAYRDDAEPGPVATALAAFKYRGTQRLGRRMAAAMTTRLPTADVTLIVPVPLHRRRLRARGFNQSAVLARQLGTLLARPVLPDLLLRVRDTPSQTALTRAGRRRNVLGAFVVGAPVRARGARVLLVDDVWTSGATVGAAAAALRAAGADAVDVLTFARVR